MDDDQQFCLRWNNHQSTLISVFDTLLENGTLVDCTLAAEGKFLKAHKVVLSACSPYFAALLSQQYDKHPIFILKDVKFQELRAMMDYMYRGEVNISQDQLAALLKAAESLQIKGLSDNSRGTSSSNTANNNNNNNAMNKPDSHVKPPPPVPAASKQAAGLTIENKRPRLNIAADLVDTDASAVSREGSTSPSRKRKKTNVRRRSIESNNVLDNHEQLSNSSSHSTTHATNNISTSTTNVLPVTKKTDHHESKQNVGENAGSDDAGADSANENDKGTGLAGSGKDSVHSELMIEPKNEYDDGDGNEPVEDLTMDDEELMEDLDQAGPSHGGEGSSSGYGNWQMERSQDEVFMAGQDGGQHRDAQESAFSILQTLLNANSAMQNRDAPAQCPYCKRVYANAQKVQTHIKKYCLKEKKYRCMFCPYRSKRRDHIIRHAAKVHESLVAEKISSGEITGPSEAFVDESEEDKLKKDDDDEMLGAGDAETDGDGVGEGEAIISAINPAVVLGDTEESDHDSDYDEDSVQPEEV